MGSRICKGKPEEEIVEIDECFPMQEKTETLDWNDVRAVHYRCAANCLHNYALGKIVEKDFPTQIESKMKKSKTPVRFADLLETSIPPFSYPTDAEYDDEWNQNEPFAATNPNLFVNGGKRHGL